MSLQVGGESVTVHGIEARLRVAADAARTSSTLAKEDRATLAEAIADADEAGVRASAIAAATGLSRTHVLRTIQTELARRQEGPTE